jgi:exodeoxyribonuclease VII large subunit
MNLPDKTEKIYTVSEITRLIKFELEQKFPALWIEGEIADFARAHSGHLYFTLKDERSALSCVMWRSNALLIPFELESGLQVKCKGQISVYEQRGKYQLYVEIVEPKGKGALQLAFEQLKEKLKKEGLFDLSLKKKLPLLPKKVGVVTSSRGAAIIDIIKTLERRFARLHILIYPVRVQGEGAGDEIVEGIDYLGSISDIDVIIVGRGGGSLEDLWAFNEEKVARAIFRCPVPVISAVGHEVDFTIADFVADIRASTPSAAAEMVIEKEQSFLERIENLEKRIFYHLQYYIQGKRHEVFALVHHKAFQHFRIRLFNLIQQVDDLESRASHVIRSVGKRMAESRAVVDLAREKLSALAKRMIQDLVGKWERLSVELDNLSPLNILKKGYTLCWKDTDGRLVQQIGEVGRGDKVRVSFFKGEFTAQVHEVDRNRPIESRLPETKEKPRRSRE